MGAVSVIYENVSAVLVICRIINASLQTLDQAVRKAALARRCIAHFVYLFYQPSHISRVEGRRACEGGK